MKTALYTLAVMAVIVALCAAFFGVIWLTNGYILAVIAVLYLVGFSYWIASDIIKRQEKQANETDDDLTANAA